MLGAIGWLTVAGFSRAPYAQLQPTARLAAAGRDRHRRGHGRPGICSGVVVRRIAASFTLWIVEIPGQPWPHGPSQAAAGDAATGAAAGRARAAAAARRRFADLTGGIGARRVLAGILLVGGLPLLTLALSARSLHLDLGDDLLIYLVAVVAVAVVGGFWPAVLAAVTASLLVNWYFTPPVHTLTIADGKSLLALLLFVTVAVTVSSVVHLAALASPAGGAQHRGGAGSRWRWRRPSLGGRTRPRPCSRT